MESNDYQLQQGTFIRTFCLEGQSQVVEVFYVKPKIIGTLKVEVKVSIIGNICSSLLQNNWTSTSDFLSSSHISHNFF